MANKNQLQVNNTTFRDSLLSAIVNMPKQKDPEGQYVWKKYTNEVINKGTVTNPKLRFTANGNDLVVTIESGNFDLSDVDDKFFDGFVLDVSTAYYFVYRNGAINYWDASKDNPLSYDSDTHTLKGSASLGLNHTATYSGTKAVEKTIRDFLDYVVSDDPNAYPDGGLQNGCWYERVEDLSVIDYGFITNPSQANSITVEHSLGVVPKHSILVGLKTVTASRTLVATDLFSAYYSGFHNADYAVANGETITFNSRNTSYPFAAMEFLWIAVA